MSEGTETTGLTTDNWYSGIDSSLHDAASKYTSTEEAVKALVNKDSVLGRSISLPKDGATDIERSEALGKIYSKLGVPETSEGYSRTKPVV